ncbi:toxin VasX [Psychrobacter glaciei]|uniref:toxin VasX n=1 Tax=Psychrobacter glaciei TaxID=619771 RepID=UPI001F06E982|nr:toxin VasX [Psychrobacter glaciei]MCH1781866.1 hypothetical protein [Psychrobacter glaciei]
MSIGGGIKSALGMNDEVADVLDVLDVLDVPERPVEPIPESESGLPSTTLDEIVVTATRDSCRYGCGDTGIPILPVVFSRDDYRVNGNDKRYFGDGLSSKSAKHDAIASLPTQAYLYYISKRINIYGSSIWSIREVFTGKDGALRYIKTYNENDFTVKSEEDIKADTNKIEVTNIDEPDDDELDEMVQPAICEKDEHSTLDSKYITLEPGEVVWLMVSHAKLSKATLKKYFHDAALRNKRMQQFVADELTGNDNTDGISFLSPEIDYINSCHQRKQLEQGGGIDDKISIAEKDLKEDVQGSWRSALQLYKSMERSINDKISDIEKDINSGEFYDDSEEGKLYKEADQKDLNILKDVKPMMVALHDPVGEVLAAAEKRNYLLSQLSEISEDKDYSRKIINALIIKNLEKSSIKTTEFKGKDIFNWGDNDVLGTALNIVFSDTNPKTLIFKHINKPNYQHYLQTSQKIIDLKKEIVSARKTFIKAISSEDFKYILENDFDIELIHEAETAKSFESMIARCIAGCGTDDSNLGVPQSILDAFETNPPKSDETTNEEFKKALLPQLDRSLGINENWLIKALGGLDKEFVKELYDFKKKDRGSEAAGAGIGYISDRASTTKLNRITDASKSSALANTTALVNTLSQNLFKLYKNNPEAAKQLHITLEKSIFHHYGLYVVGERVTARVDTITAYANLAADFVLPKFIKNGINKRASKIKAGIKSNFEDFSGLEVVKQPTFGTEAEAKTYVLHYVEEAKRTKQGTSALEPLYNGRPINLDVLNADELAAHATKWHNRRMNVGAGLVSGVVAFFQLNSLIDSMPELARLEYAGDESLLTEKQIGVASGGLALVTASMDVTASGASLLGKASFANKLVYRAGWIGVAGAVLEVGSLAIYGYRKFNDGNTASWVYTGAAAVSVSASAAAGLIYGYAAVSTATGGAAAIPGAVLLGVMMVGLSLSYGFQRLAYKYDDKQNTLIEYWLDSSIFGSHNMQGQGYKDLNPFKTFTSLAEDISGFVTACTSFVASSELSQDPITNNNGILGFTASNVLNNIKFNSRIVIENFADVSELTISVELVKNNGEVLTNIFDMSLSSTNGSPLSTGSGVYFHRNQVIIKKEKNATVIEIRDIYIEDSVYSEDSIKKGKVIIKYIPDSTQNPIYPLYNFSYMDNEKY